MNFRHWYARSTRASQRMHDILREIDTLDRLDVIATKAGDRETSRAIARLQERRDKQLHGLIEAQRKLHAKHDPAWQRRAS